MTPRQKVERALRGGHSDTVPFTVYELFMTHGTVEREMRNRGLCIVVRNTPVVKTHHPKVKITDCSFTENGRRMTRTVYETPSRTLSVLGEPSGHTVWLHERMFKTRDDYAAILFWIQDEAYEPNYDAFKRGEESFGEDAIFRAGIGYEPLQTLISGPTKPYGSTSLHRSI